MKKKPQRWSWGCSAQPLTFQAPKPYRGELIIDNITDNHHSSQCSLWFGCLCTKPEPEDHPSQPALLPTCQGWDSFGDRKLQINQEMSALGVLVCLELSPYWGWWLTLKPNSTHDPNSALRGETIWFLNFYFLKKLLMTDPSFQNTDWSCQDQWEPQNQEWRCRCPKTGKELPDGCQCPCQGHQSFQTLPWQNSELPGMATHPVVEFCSWETPQNPAWTSSPWLGECGTKGAAWVW